MWCQDLETELSSGLSKTLVPQLSQRHFQPRDDTPRVAGWPSNYIAFTCWVQGLSDEVGLRMWVKASLDSQQLGARLLALYHSTAVIEHSYER